MELITTTLATILAFVFVAIAWFSFLFVWHLLAESAGHGFRKGWDRAGEKENITS